MVTFFSFFLHSSAAAAAAHTITQPFEVRNATCGKPNVYRGTSYPAPSHIWYLCNLVDNTHMLIF